MLDAFIIEEIKRREEERRRRESERPRVDLPEGPVPNRPVRQGEEENPSRGVVIIENSP
jgi:hypothetical protein